MHDVWQSAQTLRPEAHRLPHVRPATIMVVIPLFETPELVPGLASALLAVREELRAIGARILFVNDSPDHSGLRSALALALPELEEALDVELVTNAANIGFLRSVNEAMARARAEGCDVILLNSDALPRPGAFAEMAAVAYLDPMIGAVSPRSDNATICNSPYLDDLRSGGPDRAYAAHLAIARHLPRYSYAPTCVGFCMYIRGFILDEFGLFDEVYGAGYNEENDLIRRINRRGYRAVLANHAYVHHIGEVSFSRSGVAVSDRDLANRMILLDRFPEYAQTVDRFFQGPEYRTQRILAGLVPDAEGRLRLLFDCRVLGCYFSGTLEHACALLRAFARAHHSAFDIHVLCDEDAFLFHGLNSVQGLKHCREEEVRGRPFAVVMRIGQPFKLTELALLEEAAAICGVLMLDTIAYDCQHLDEADLDTIWNRLCRSVDLIGFNSAFSQDQFNRRFAVPARVLQFISRCSTDVREYALGPGAPPARDEILVVGNHFPHKFVSEMVHALRRAEPDCRIIVLGVQVEEPGVECHVAGLLPDEVVASLYDRARVVVLPSHYEGFGLPIIHGLARARPVVARDLPSAREIKEVCPEAINLHLALTTQELVAKVLARPEWIAPDKDTPPPVSWPDAADAIARVVELALERFDYAALRARIGTIAFDRLRTDSPDPIQANMPRIGEGFMLGPSIEFEVAYNARPRSWRAYVTMWLDRRQTAERDIVRSAEAGGTSYEYLNLRVADHSEHLSTTQAHLLQWLCHLRLGGRVRVSMDIPAAAAHEAETEQTARLMLVNCGISVDAVKRRGRSVIVDGTKRRDWQAMLPGPEDDKHFVAFLYRQVLGRNPDDGGGTQYLRELRQGTDRQDVLRSLMCSQERRALIGRQLRRAEMR